MPTLILGLVIFLGHHSISIFADGWRSRMRDRIGARAWRIAFSLNSIIGFLLIIKGYGAARLEPIVVYQPPTALSHLAVLLMLPAFPMLLAAYFPGRIKSALKHPMLAAVKLWALAHLLANGTLADVVLFGAFLAWAVADRISYKHRTIRPTPGAPPGKLNDVIVVVAGLVLYALFLLWLHRAWIGVAPIPGLGA
jgi:uncharacterized membrane protein